MNERTLTFSRGATFEKPSSNYVQIKQPASKPNETYDSSEGSIASEDALSLTPKDFNLKKGNYDVMNSVQRNASSIKDQAPTSLFRVDFPDTGQKPLSFLQPELESGGTQTSNVSLPFFPVSPKDSNKTGGGKRSSRRQSKFFTLQKPKEATTELQVGDGTTKNNQFKNSKSDDFLKSHIDPEFKFDEEPASALPMLGNEKKPRPSMISALKRQNTKRESTKHLTPSQFHLIDDKVVHSENKKKLLVNVGTGDLTNRYKPRKSKLLDKISLIAARGVSNDDSKTENPATIFKHVLKKVNPNSLHKAEKNLRRRYLMRLKKKTLSLIKFPFQIFSPEDTFCLSWNIFIPFVVAFDTFFTPFMIAFYTDDRYHEFLNLAEVLIPIFFGLDIFINFRTSFYDKGVLITDSTVILKNYLRQGFAADFITVLTDTLSVIYLDTPVWYVKVMSVIRLKKLWDIITRSEDFLIMSRVWHALIKLLKLWGGIIVVAHWLACAFYYLAQQLRQRGVATWIEDNDLDGAGVGPKYITAFYWSITTMVTVGYGDIVPISDAERVYVVVAMIIASVLFGYSLNTVGDIIREMNHEKDQRREKIRSVRKYMNQKNLGKNIQIRVKNYLQYMIESRMLYKHDDEEFFDLLSQNLKDEIISEVNGKILAESKLFSVNFTVKAASRLATHMKEMFASPEEVIFDEGDEKDSSIFFIVYGKIQIDYKVRKVKVLEKGDNFGEIGFFTGQPRNARAKSLFFTNLYSLKREIAVEKLVTMPSDFEIFHLIKDNINLYGDYSQLEIKCYSCGQSGHVARSCPEIHFKADKEEVIREYLSKQQLFRSKFRRSMRPKFNPRVNLETLKTAGDMIQEDYNDYTLSDEDLSQDSLDIILERNLILLPGAEVNDMKHRKVNRNRKSTRLSANLLLEQVISVHDMIGRRGSQMLSQNIIRDEPPPYDPMGIKSATGEYLFFTLDKVENFELYFPQNNVIKLITEFEKQRFENLLESKQGVAKALVIRNFGSMLKSNKGPHKSPLFYVNLSKDRILQRGRKKKETMTEKQMPVQRLKTLMEHVIQKRRRKKQKKELNDEYEADGTSESGGSSESESSFEEITKPIIIKKEETVENDEATLPRSDRLYERRQTNPSLHMGKLGSLNPKMMNKTGSDLQRLTSRTSSADTVHKRFEKKGDGEKHLDSGDRSFDEKDDKNLLQDFLRYQKKTPKGGTVSQRKSSRSMSQGNLDEMQRLLDKIDPHTFNKMVEAKLNKTITAKFGS